MYSDLSWFRSHGVPEEDISDADLTAHIKEVSLFIDDFTGMWFESRKKTYILDGSGQEVLYVFIPIIKIRSIKLGETDVALENFEVYNSIDLPDDRKNPRISRPSGSYFPVGKKNIEIIGNFGYTIEGDPVNLPALIGVPVFTGSGIDDLSSSGVYTGESDIDLTVIVDGTGATDTYKFTTDGGETYTENVVMLSGSVELAEGIAIEFDAQTGHTLGDRWDITAEILQPNRVTPYDIVKICRMLVLNAINYPIEDAYTQLELDMNTRIKSETTDKHRVEYRDIALGSLQSTGINIIDGVLFKYKELRPRYVGWV
jgi:hypothetical protein